LEAARREKVHTGGKKNKVGHHKRSRFEPRRKASLLQEKLRGGDAVGEGRCVGPPEVDVKKKVSDGKLDRR